MLPKNGILLEVDHSDKDFLNKVSLSNTKIQGKSPKDPVVAVYMKIYQGEL